MFEKIKRRRAAKKQKKIRAQTQFGVLNFFEDRSLAALSDAMKNFSSAVNALNERRPGEVNNSRKKERKKRKCQKY